MFVFSIFPELADFFKILTAFFLCDKILSMPVTLKIFKEVQIKNITVFFLYLVFFMTLFAQFPLKTSLPGNCDTTLAIAAGNDYLNRIASHLGGGGSGTYFYGSAWNHGFGESSVLGLSVYAFFRALGFNDVNAYYFFISLLFASTGFAVFLLATLYTESLVAALFAGFAFTCSNFMFANIDDHIVLWYFFPALSVFFLKRFFGTGANRYLYLSAAAAALQTYVSSYVFVFQTAMLAIVALCEVKKLRPSRHLVGAAGIFLLLSAPFFAGYLFVLRQGQVVDTWQSMRNVIPAWSLKPADLTYVLPGNLLYDHPMFGKYYARDVRLHAFLGCLLYSLALAGAFLRTKGKKELLLIALAGFILAVGPVLRLGGFAVPFPMGLVYGLHPIFSFLRVPVRGFFISSMALSILAATALGWALSFLRSKTGLRAGYAALAAVPFFTLHFLENVPFPLKSFDYGKHYRIPGPYLDLFKDKKDSVILDLPNCGIYSIEGSERPVYGYNREAVYMIWQTHHRQNIVNGVYGYFPAKRLELQAEIEKLPAPGLFREHRIDYIVYHKDKELEEDTCYSGLRGPALYNKIAGLPGMVKVYEDSGMCVIRNTAAPGAKAGS